MPARPYRIRCPLLLSPCRPASASGIAGPARPRFPPGMTASAAPASLPFGRLPDGRETRLHRLHGADGFAADIADYGGTVVNLVVPDRKGRPVDVALGLPDAARYAAQSPYFGCLVGRVGNRIAGARFVLGGRTHTLAANDQPGGRPCTLHGGKVGFDKVIWQAEPAVVGGRPALRLRHLSPDGDEGFPGNLRVEVVYSLTADRGLRLDYSAATDAPTPVNLTNHLYFNLEGEGRGDILDHKLMIAADRIVAVDEGLIPTGELAPVEGTPFDFRAAHRIGGRIGAGHEQLRRGLGYDHTFVLATAPRPEPVLAARAVAPRSGLVLEVLTTEPGVQLYTGNFLDGSITGKSGRPYPHRSGFCLETQHFPDAINQPSFANTVLQPGQTYRSTTIYRFPAG